MSAAQLAPLARLACIHHSRGDSRLIFFRRRARWTDVFGCAADPIEMLRRPWVRSPLDLRDQLNELSDDNAVLVCNLESAQLAAGLTEQVSAAPQ